MLTKLIIQQKHQPTHPHPSFLPHIYTHSKLVSHNKNQLNIMQLFVFDWPIDN